MWNEDAQKWDGLKEGLFKIYGKNGNVVVFVTTSSKDVASMMETSLGSPLSTEMRVGVEEHQ